MRIDPKHWMAHWVALHVSTRIKAHSEAETPAGLTALAYAESKHQPPPQRPCCLRLSATKRARACGPWALWRAVQTGKQGTGVQNPLSKRRSSRPDCKRLSGWKCLHTARQFMQGNAPDAAGGARGRTRAPPNVTTPPGGGLRAEPLHATSVALTPCTQTLDRHSPCAHAARPAQQVLSKQSCKQRECDAAAAVQLEAQLLSQAKAARPFEPPALLRGACTLSVKVYSARDDCELLIFTPHHTPLAECPLTRYECYTHHL